LFNDLWMHPKSNLMLDAHCKQKKGSTLL